VILNRSLIEVEANQSERVIFGILLLTLSLILALFS